MRYLFLAVLLTIVTAAATALEATQPASHSAIRFFQESGLGPYLLGGPILLGFIAIGYPGSLSSFLHRYRLKGSLAASGFFAMFGFGLVILLIVSALLALSGQVSWGEGAVKSQSNAFLLTVASAVCLACVVAIAEEPLFRGFLVGYLRWSKSAAVTIGAVVTSAFVFALAHNLQDPFAWFAADDFPLFVGLFLLGILLAVAYLVTRSLWCPIGLHAALVAFDLAILKGEVIIVDLSPWWLGGSDDVRGAPLIWLTWVVAALVLVGCRKMLLRRFAVEKSFVGALFSPQSPNLFTDRFKSAIALSSDPSHLERRSPSLEQSSQGV